MNKIYKFRAVLIIALAHLLISSSLWAQAPEKMSYQAVIRNSSGALVASTNIGMQISILQGSESGTAVYVETQTPTTNVNGLVSIEIGAGTVVIGNFATIDWANGPYFIKTETDPTGGTTYTITGTSQLLSVPYALHAKIAGTVTGGITDFTIGQSYGGGIIFWLDASGQHGLIAATADQSTGIQWSNGSYTTTGATLDGVYAGKTNTDLIIANQGAGSYAAQICADYSVTVNNEYYDDWYLPSKYELNLLYQQKDAVGGFASAPYWSSTEYDSDDAWRLDFLSGSQDINGDKSYLYKVRAVRRF